jgi:phospholipase/carboxylesterase
MPATTSHETAEHPVEGFRSLALPAAPAIGRSRRAHCASHNELRDAVGRTRRAHCASHNELRVRVARVYLPTDYQPKYAYPLVVLFHADGECDGRAVQLVPQLSRRNYVALCLRGDTKRGLRTDGRPAFGWDAAADRGAKAALTHVLSEYSVHPDRVFLVGVGEGVAAACRFGLAPGTRVAGVVALNGAFPTERVQANHLRVLIAHGSANPVVPFAEARRAAARLTAAGATVRLSRYATSQRVHADMLRDANRWIMAQVAAGK